MPDKGKILLHICCAPDATAVVEQLQKEFEVTGFFYNPNIHPASEYRKRLQATREVSSYMDFKLLVPDYEPEVWLRAVRGLEKEPERGLRCEACFTLNLLATAAKAQELDIPIFTTTLTISPHKRSDVIRRIGLQAAQAYNLCFLKRDFKKQEGFKRSLELSQKFKLYRQRYCGCRFSLRVTDDA